MSDVKGDDKEFVGFLKQWTSRNVQDGGAGPFEKGFMVKQRRKSKN